MSQGKNEEEARRNIKDAIVSVLLMRMGMLVAEGTSPEASVNAGSAEESYRLKEPELVAV
jgi:hypothetical protein